MLSLVEPGQDQDALGEDIPGRVEVAHRHAQSTRQSLEDPSIGFPEAALVAADAGSSGVRVGQDEKNSQLGLQGRRA